MVDRIPNGSELPQWTPQVAETDTKKFLENFLPAGTPSSSLESALDKYADKLTSKDTATVQEALENICKELHINTALLQGPLKAFASTISSLNTVQETPESSTKDEIEAAELQDIETLIQGFPNDPQLPAVQSTLVFEFHMKLNDLASEPLTPAQFEKAVNELLENFEEGSACIDKVQYLLTSGVINPEQFASITHAFLLMPEVKNDLLVLVEDLSKGKVTSQELDKKIQEIQTVILQGTDKTSKANVSMWMMSCSVEFFLVASLIAQLLTQIDKEQSLLAIKMKQCMIETALTVYALARTMTDAKVAQIQNEAQQLFLEGAMSFVQAGISLGATFAQFSIPKGLGKEELQAMTAKIELIKSVLSQTTQGAQSMTKASLDLQKATLAGYEGQMQAITEFLKTAIQLFQDSIQKLQEGSNKAQEILKELMGMAQSLQRLSGEVRG